MSGYGASTGAATPSPVVFNDGYSRLLRVSLGMGTTALHRTEVCGQIYV